MKTFYLGAEREATLTIGPDKHQPDWPGLDQLPLPNCTWKDLYQELNQPYPGGMGTLVGLGQSDPGQGVSGGSKLWYRIYCRISEKKIEFLSRRGGGGGGLE